MTVLTREPTTTPHGLPVVTPDKTAAEHEPTDKYGALLVAAEAVRIAVEFGLPEPDGIGVGPTGVIEAAMPTEAVLGWTRVLDKPKVDKVRATAGVALLVSGRFERRSWLLRSTEVGAW